MSVSTKYQKPVTFFYMNYVGVASLLQFSVQVQKPNTVLNPDRQFSVKLSVSFALAISDGKVGNPEHPIFPWIL